MVLAQPLAPHDGNLQRWNGTWMRQVERRWKRRVRNNIASPVASHLNQQNIPHWPLCKFHLANEFPNYVSVSLIYVFFLISVVDTVVFCSEHKEKLFRFPKTGDEVRGMHEVIEHYKAENFGIVLLAYCSIFINFVSCCVPGTGCLSILAAPIFGPYFGFLIMHSCAIIGAVNCYFISM